MLFRLIRAVVVLVVVVAAAAFLLGWWGSTRVTPVDQPNSAVGTAGERPRSDVPTIDRDRAREVGAQVGERTAAAAEQAQRAVSDASLTGKIKAKMTLDDTVKALKIDVDTSGGVVTLSGSVDNEAQHQRALALARETNGVKQVVDRLQVRQ